MKKSIGFCEFEQTFCDYGRSDNFSSTGLQVLFDYMEELEEATGEEIELDVVGLCCEYSESTFEEVAQDYSNMFALDCSAFDEDTTPEERAEALKEQVLEFLNENTSVVGEVDDDSVIYLGF